MAQVQIPNYPHPNRCVAGYPRDMRGGNRRPWETVAKDNVQRFTVLWNSGLPTRRMAEVLEVSISTLWKVRKRLGLPPRRPASD